MSCDGAEREISWRCCYGTQSIQSHVYLTYLSTWLLPVQAQGAQPYNGAVRGSECGGLAGIPGRALAHRSLHLAGRAHSGQR